MAVGELLVELERRNVQLVADGERLRFRPQHLVTPELREALVQHKHELLALLAQGQSEELEYLPSGAPPVVYDLQVVSITSKGASTASARRRARHARAARAGEPVVSIASTSRTGASAGSGSAFATRSAR